MKVVHIIVAAQRPLTLREMDVALEIQADLREVINRILPSFPWRPDIRVLNTFFLGENWTPQPDCHENCKRLQRS